MRWFRFYDEVLDDPKVRRLPAVLAWAWVLILCAANRHTPRGTVPGLQDLAFLLRASQKKTRSICERLRQVGLLDMDDEERTFLIHNWNVRQREYDLSTNRTRTFRERSPNNPDTDTETEEIQKQKQRRETVVLGEREFLFPPGLMERWVIAYPAVDVRTELHAAFEWVQANPANRKSNWQRFLVAWLKRSQDRAPAKGNGESEKIPPPEVLTRPPMTDEERAKSEAMRERVMQGVRKISAAKSVTAETERMS